MSFLNRLLDNGSPRQTAKANLTTGRVTTERTGARKAAGRIGALSALGKKNRT
ncbi:hypothetical protein OG730_41870 (plasmid) [Streptomyces sp. NBC_01298]|uniref:hypothetical protein n=1 Tax=Streptomyces sp. NBC_01298 TaxID=2903817 RepID=UPI002E1162C4|nr:hypothetical protein OG730_41870 [Streptomyces sp. NBC_01298]